MNVALVGPAGWVLLLLSIGVLTVSFERFRFWFLWWRNRRSHQHQWKQQCLLGGQHPLAWMEERDREMRFAEPFLEAITVIAPLIGLIGTVLGLARLLSSLGPQLVLPPDSDLSGFGGVLMATALGLIVGLLATVTLHVNNALRLWQRDRWKRDLPPFRTDPPNG